MDPLEMFRQAAPNGIVNKEIRKSVPGKDLASQLDDPIETQEVFENSQTGTKANKDETVNEKAARVIDTLLNSLSNLRSDFSSSSKDSIPKDKLKDIKTPNLGTSGRTDRDAVTASGASSADKIVAHEETELAPGDAEVAPADSSSTQADHEEMSRITPAECPFLMNRE